MSASVLHTGTICKYFETKSLITTQKFNFCFLRAKTHTVLSSLNSFQSSSGQWASSVPPVIHIIIIFCSLSFSFNSLTVWWLTLVLNTANFALLSCTSFPPYKFLPSMMLWTLWVLYSPRQFIDAIFFFFFSYEWSKLDLSRLGIKQWVHTKT